MRQGSRGTAVFTLQRQLNRITKDYPFLGKLTVDGVFGSQDGRHGAGRSKSSST